MPPKTPYKKGTYKGKVCYSRNNRNGQPYVTCNSNLEKPRKKAPSKKARVEKPKELYDIELLKILRSHRDANVISETQDKDIKALLKKIDKSIADRLQKNASEIAKIESSNIPKKEKVDVVEKKNLSALIDTDLLKTIYDTFTGQYSSRMKDKLIKLIKDERTVKSLFESRFDFFPTPSECILSMGIDFAQCESLLEPTAGMGMILYTALLQNPALKTTAYEYDDMLCAFLKTHFPNTTVHCGDFLDTYDAGNYDTIVCNPPFNSPYKNAYIMFLIKCLCIAMFSKYAHHLRDVYFICPPLFEKEQEVNGRTIDPSKLMDIKAMTKPMKDKVIGETSKWGIGIDEFIDNIRQIMFISTCAFNVKTTIKASMYHFIVSRQ